MRKNKAHKSKQSKKTKKIKQEVFVEPIDANKNHPIATSAYLFNLVGFMGYKDLCNLSMTAKVFNNKISLISRVIDNYVFLFYLFKSFFIFTSQRWEDFICNKELYREYKKLWDAKSFLRLGIFYIKKN